jgi:glutathione S-transferase
MQPKPEDITLFYWSFSPWASKVTAYLVLRSLPHSQCDQPITLPRPDIKALGVSYRRIPVLAIGRDIYCDTLCILQSLERLFPSDDLRATNPTDRALEKLLEKWTDVVVFKPAAGAIPSTLPLCQDPSFIKDRTELWGRDWEPKEQDKLRPAGLANLRENFEFLEELLSDRREWVLGNDGPKLGDIHGEWKLRECEGGVIDHIASGLDLRLDAQLA